jgi:hypothetical protein
MKAAMAANKNMERFTSPPRPMRALGVAGLRESSAVLRAFTQARKALAQMAHRELPQLY